MDQLQGVLQTVQSHWLPKSATPNPLELALPLLDKTSVGKADQYPEFLRLQQKLTASLKNAVDQHYQAFNDSVGSYGITVENVNESCTTLSAIRESLVNARSNLLEGDSKLACSLALQSQQNEQVLELLEAIGTVSQCADNVDSLFSSSLASACENCATAFSTAQKYNLWDLSGLQGLKVRLESQRSLLFEALVEGLHSEVYIKSQLLFDTRGKGDVDAAVESLEKGYRRFLDGTKEGNFARIESILSSLNKLSLLSHGITILKERSLLELGDLASRCVEETRSRHPQYTSTIRRMDFPVENGLENPGHVILQDLFYTVFSALVIVLHRLSVIEKFLCDLPDISVSLSQFWNIIEKQVGEFLSGYIVADANAQPDSGHLFKFGSVESFPQATAIADSLETTLKKLCPDYTVHSAKGSSLFVESTELRSEKPLVPNVSVWTFRAALDPFLVFVACGSHLGLESERFFQKFMLETFKPELRKTLVEMFERAADFKSLVANSCKTLGVSLRYRPEYVEIVLELIDLFITHQEKSFEHVSPVGSRRSKFLAQWIDSPQLASVTLQILVEGSEEMIDKEIDLFLMKGVSLLESSRGGISKSDIMNESDFELLVQLLHRVSNVLSWLPSIKRVSTASTDSDLRHRWILMEPELGESFQIWVAGNSAQEYDNLISRLKSLVDRISISLRYDLRCKAIYYIGRCLEAADWCPEEERKSIDSNVKLLNQTILNVSSQLEAILGEERTASILTGLPQLIDRLVVLGTGKITRLNGNGVSKLVDFVLVFQQTLRSVMPDPQNVDFSRSLAYLELFRISELGVIEQIKSGKNRFSLEQNRNMMRLIFSDEMAKSLRSRTSSLGSSKRYSSSLQALEALFE